MSHIHLELLKKEVQRLANLGVLEMQSLSEWTSSTFIIPKKNYTEGLSLILGK